jgi:peptidyl-tRNA hydrolase
MDEDDPDTGAPDTGAPDTGAPDTGAEVPWGLQIVARVERDQPPGVADLVTAAAVGVVRLLADVRTALGGPWAEAVARWDGGPIRKLVRRARGAAWERATTLPGVSVAHGGASVHVVPPGPVRPLPPELDRLQVAGLVVGGLRPAAWRSPADWWGVRVAVTPEGDLSGGKLAAQAGHAAHLAWRGMDAARRARWARAGLAVEVAFPAPDAWARLVATAPFVVHDAGFTETSPGQRTAVALV